MILLCGIPSEPPLARVTEALATLGLEHRVFNQRRAADARMSLSVRDGQVDGELDLYGERLRLADVTGVYVRMMDDQHLPELAADPPDGPLRRHVRGVHEVLQRWAEIAPATVINRAGAQGSNASKIYQAQLITRHGFKTPPTLVTNQPDAVRAFVALHARVIYKSMSGVRSIVRALDRSDLARLDRIRWCPVQFQAWVPGVEVRVHVIGEALFATRIDSDVSDYRYADRLGGAVSLHAVELPEALAARCLRLTRGLGLELAGIDLKVTPAGEVYCFEVNPSPAFSYFEAHTAQPIARAIARRLAG